MITTQKATTLPQQLLITWNLAGLQKILQKADQNYDLFKKNSNKNSEEICNHIFLLSSGN